MKHRFSYTIYLFSGLILSHILSDFRAAAEDATWNYAVEVGAYAQTDPSPRMNLVWVSSPRATGYSVYRKTLSATNWTVLQSDLPGNATSYVDTTVGPGQVFEYQVIKTARDGSLSWTGSGYVAAGIQGPLIESRGKVVLLIDDQFAASLATEIARLEEDLAGDDWMVLKNFVSRSSPPAAVKSIIVNHYQSDPSQVKAVFLLGHIPVPYSGNIAPDGHTPDHQGAWPADVYYGDMDGTWTDDSVDVTDAGGTRNDNTPGDGKFDQSTLPSDVELQVGRVDLFDMPAAGTDELTLLRRYLDKNHNYRHKNFTASRSAGLMGNSAGDRDGEAFAASGYRTFAALLGGTLRANVESGSPVNERWISRLTAADSPFLWAYGCGGGDSAKCDFLGTHGSLQEVWTDDIVLGDAKAVFVMLLGSHFGDWDSRNNLMRGVLATPTAGLTCSWSGRPHHFYHHMGMGETVGYGIRISQNNSGSLYVNHVQNSLREVHIALMGDPTLRLHQMSPPSNLNGAMSGSGTLLTWTGSSEPALLGYHVYRSSSRGGRYTRINELPITGTSYNDGAVTSGTFHYFVKALKLEDTTSGSYTNSSQGIYAFVSNGAPGDVIPSVANVDVTGVGINRPGATTPPLNTTVVSNTVTRTPATNNDGVAATEVRINANNVRPEETRSPFTHRDSSTVTNVQGSSIAARGTFRNVGNGSSLRARMLSTRAKRTPGIAARNQARIGRQATIRQSRTGAIRQSTQAANRANTGTNTSTLVSRRQRLE